MATTIIGGKNYRWRGRAIRTITKDGSTCVTMPRKDSMIMAPINVNGESQYKITVTASRNSGNGALLVNFFGGKNYDGPHIPINITNAEMRDYTIAVPTPKFPNNLPIYLRVWRPNDASGNLIVRNIQLTKIGDHIQLPREPRLPRVKPNNSNKVKSQKVPRIKNRKILPRPIIKPKEVRDMKFKPYTNAKATSKVSEVLINSASDVPKVSIITPTRDGKELIEKCWEALDKNTSYPNWEWIVGDSNSTDGTVEYLERLKDPRIKVIQRGTTEGSFSSINNELTKHATGEYFLFLNNDTEPQPFWLYEMVSKINRNPEIGIVGAKLLYSENKVQHAGIVFIPQGPANLGKAVLSSFPKGFADHDRYYQAVTGACLLMRESDFRQVGGFDPVYYFCYEDVDLCLKVRYNLNKKVLYASRAKLLHKESVTQKKHKTGGELQKKGIQVFKDRWMSKVQKDFGAYQKDIDRGKVSTDISFITCVNDMQQFSKYIYGSLFKSDTLKNYEIIPILNFGNPYSASQALNLGIDKATSNILVLCHQDVIFYKEWVDMLFDRINEIESIDHNWGVLGTAGINTRDDTAGVVHSIKGTLQWQPNRKARVYEVQTVDEHCMIIRKNSGLRFDEKNFNGFHFYGPDICLNSLDRGYKNFGILCPLVHDSGGGSLVSGKREFMRLLHALAKKWRPKYPTIRTATSVIKKRSIRTFIRFKNQ